VQRSYSPWSFIAADLFPYAALIIGSLFGLYFSRPRPVPNQDLSERPSSKVRRLALAILALLYLVTWTFGVPAVTTALMSEAVQEQRALLDYRGKHHYERPQYKPTMVAVRVAFAPFPGLVAVLAETQQAGTCDWCGWSFFLWWPGGTHHLGTRLYWIT
jgi:hypothetical protein